MRWLAALLSWLLIAAAAPVVAPGPVQLCALPALAVGACQEADLTTLRPGEGEIVLARAVEIRPEALPLDRPIAVTIVAMASSELHWNGVPIGRNGVPGADAAGERPGLFIASFIVPAQLLRPGRNLVTARLSAHHLWLPVQRPIHEFEVGPYLGEELPGVSTYLPALLVLGALAGAFIYFAAAAFSERRNPAPLLLALVAAAAMLQLAIEVSRAFVAYTYPWHLARVSLIAILAAATAVAAAAYAAHRFSHERRRLLVRSTAAAALLSLVLIPWYDLKALGAILAAAIAIALCGARGVRRGQRDGWLALAFAAAIPLLIAWQLTGFLDRAWFILLAIFLVALVAEQVRSLRRARAERDAESRRAAALAERLARAEREGEPVLALKDGSRTHRVAESDILFIRAADDYCEAVLVDGRAILVTMTLSRLLATLPERFVRVHKSYAANRAHVAGTAPKAGGGRVLKISNGTEVPVGRTYSERVAAALS